MNINTPWISRPNPRPNASLRLFCFPYAGGGAVIYRDWYQGLPAHIEVCGLELPGHFSRRREPLIRDILELVQAMERAVEPLLDRPFALFGYSLGALVAFTLARSIRRRTGLSPQALMVAAARAPQVPRSLPAIGHEPRATFIRELERRYGPIDPTIKAEPDLMEAILDITRADIAVLESYQHVDDEPFACPLLAFGGKDDGTLSPAMLDAWREHTRESFDARWLPGGHFFIRDAGRELLGMVRDALRAPASHTAAQRELGFRGASSAQSGDAP